MTLSDAIARTDALRPNSFTRRQKLDWLSALDGAVMAELINTHEGGESAPDTRLLVPPPYEEVYLRYLEAQMDYANGEFDRFNNSNAMYAAAWTAFANYYNRTHMPRGGKKKYY